VQKTPSLIVNRSAVPQFLGEYTHEAVRKLDEAGFAHVYNFERGAQEWREAGGKLQAATEVDRQSNISPALFGGVPKTAPSQKNKAVINLR
jgi:hypothetical protein